MSMRYPGGLIATSPVNARYPSGVWTQAQAAPYQAQNVWTRDQFWPYTTLLLQGDGAVNGAQNNTFLDSSSNNFTITRNGNTTQGSFTPYEQDGYWSNYFDGSGDFLTLPSTSALAFGTGDFTVEMWVYTPAAASTQNLFTNANASTGGDTGFGLFIINTTQIRFASWNTTFLNTGSNVVVANQWNHIAVSRSGTTASIFVNGIRQATGTVSNNFSSTNAFYVGTSVAGGDQLTGYISNLRAVKGTAVYDPTQTTITPPAAPLTAITNTSLLTCQSNRFKDNSTNNFTLTRNGDTSVQAFQPFPGATTWSASVLGGSGYFDGSGDSLSVAANQTNLYLNGVDSTVEGWFYLNAAPGGIGSSTPFFLQGNGLWSSGTEVNWWVFADGSSIYAGGGGGSAYITASVSNVPVRQWFHLAVVYSSGTSATLYINGVSVATGSVDAVGNNSSYQTRIGGPYLSGGGSGTNNFLNGYASNVRIVKGTRVYTANFTPPPAPLTAITNTQLLLSCTNAGIYDNSMMNNLETVGNAQVSTSVVKYGTGSMAFDGTGDWLLTRTSPNLDLGTGDFTFECWLYITNTIIDYRMLVSDATNGNNYITLRGGGTGGQVEINVNGTSFRINLNNSISQNVWAHFAVVRTGSTFTAYVNGVSLGTGSSSAAFNLGNGGMYVGRFGGATAYEWPGYIDDLRITKGAARYITNFTPPIARLPAQ